MRVRYIFLSLLAGVLLVAAYAAAAVYLGTKSDQDLTLACLKMAGPPVPHGDAAAVPMRCVRMLSVWPDRLFTLHVCLVVPLLFLLSFAVVGAWQNRLPRFCRLWHCNLLCWRQNNQRERHSMSEQSTSGYTLPDRGSRNGNRFSTLPQGDREAVEYAAKRQVEALRASGSEVPSEEVIRQILARDGDKAWMREEYTRACEAGDETALSVQKKFTPQSRGR